MNDSGAAARGSQEPTPYGGSRDRDGFVDGQATNSGSGQVDDDVESLGAGRTYSANN